MNRRYIYDRYDLVCCFCAGLVAPIILIVLLT